MRQPTGGLGHDLLVGRWAEVLRRGSLRNRPLRHAPPSLISGASRCESAVATASAKRHRPPADQPRGMQPFDCRPRADGSWGNRAARKRRSHQEKGVPSDVAPLALRVTRFARGQPPFGGLPPGRMLRSPARAGYRLIPELSSAEARPKPFAALCNLLIRNLHVSPS